MARVYVAAPFEDAKKVLRVHDLLVARGHAPTSDWAEMAVGRQDEAHMRNPRLDPYRLQNIADNNDSNIGQSDAMIVMAREGAGGEMFCEIRWALLCALPVYWTGERRILSTYRRGVVICESVEDAIDQLPAVQRTA